MKSRLTLSAISLVTVVSLVSPAFAGKVRVPTDGNFQAFNVTVINQTGDFIRGGLITLEGSTLVFNYDTGDTFSLPVTAPNSTGTVGFAFEGFLSNFTEQPTYQLPLSGFIDLSATSPDFVDNDPALTLDVAPEPHCDGGDCTAVTFPDTITVKSSVTPPSTPEPATVLPFGIGAVGLGALALRARKRQKIAATSE